ncbi:MAG: hypothetical protein ACM3ZA_11215 [Bacillota bacterium]
MVFQTLVSTLRRPRALLLSYLFNLAAALLPGAAAYALVAAMVGHSETALRPTRNLLMTLLSDLTLVGISTRPLLTTLALTGLVLSVLYLLVRPLVQAAVAAALADGAEGEARRMRSAPGRHWRSYYGLAAIGLVLNLLLFLVPAALSGGQPQRALPLLFLISPFVLVLRLQSDYARAAALETRSGWQAWLAGWSYLKGRFWLSVGRFFGVTLMGLLVTAPLMVVEAVLPRGGWPAVLAVVIGQFAVLTQVWAEVSLQGVALRAWGSDPS